ncbi:DMT family transporter [Williamsia sp. MIQD14]|uniref:DMT family transporter n=1 Tax=Williamsia sp. MIQD14 TaxID=3425703 RepID=UPI003DA07F98
MGWFFLAIAVLAEVSGTVALRVAASGRRVFYLAVAVGYAISFVALSATLAAGVGLGVAYGIWAATGVALTALAGRVLFGEALTRVIVLGIVAVMAGVVLIEVGAR